MYAVGNFIYVSHAKGYVKCVLHVDVQGNYYLVSTKTVLDKLPESYRSLTWAELVRCFGDRAVKTEPGSEPESPAKSEGKEK